MEEGAAGKTEALISSVASPLKVSVSSESGGNTPSTAASSPSTVLGDGCDFGSSGLESGLGPAVLDFSGEASESQISNEQSPAPSPEVQRLYWEGFFVNLPMFAGYAALFGLQHQIKAKFDFSDTDVAGSREFGVAVSFLYIFNLIFRFSHNILFGFMGPRGRTYIAMMAMMSSMLVIALAIFIFESRNLLWVYLAYALGGVGVGTFEANFLCCLTPLGPRTKHMAITAIPIGILVVLVGAFFLMGPPFYVPVTALYIGVAGLIFCGIATFAFRIPKVKSDKLEVETQGVRKFVDEIRQWRQWLPLVWHLPVATMIDMFTLSAFCPGVALYIYDQKHITLFPGVVLANADYFVIYNTFNMLGGMTGRILSYRLRPRHPLFYTLFNITGSIMLLFRIPALAAVSTFVIMVGDGLIYGTIAKRIDATVPKQFNLVALSFWLFVGDFGSVTGSNLISYIKIWVVGH